jgi:hypothetical protein
MGLVPGAEIELPELNQRAAWRQCLADIVKTGVLHAPATQFPKRLLRVAVAALGDVKSGQDFEAGRGRTGIVTKRLSC